jgi:hypothetical protein
MKFSKEEIEKIPVNQFVIGNYKENLDCLNRKILDLISMCINEFGLKYCNVIRAIYPVHEINNELSEWYSTLKMNSKPPTYELTGGAAITWGNGELDSTYGIVVVVPFILEGLEKDDLYAQKTIIHELTHIHTEVRIIKEIGPVAFEPTYCDESDKIIFRLALYLWSEFCSELVASNIIDDASFEERKSLTFRAIRRAEDIIGLMASTNADKLSESISIANNTLLEIGRFLGNLIKLNEEEREQIFSEFFLWGSFLRYLYSELNVINNEVSLSPAVFEKICFLIKNQFKTIGLFRNN